MDHPNIAKVLDAGTTGRVVGRRQRAVGRIRRRPDKLRSTLNPRPSTIPPGRPYFVMELVKGVPITEFCDARKLTTRERLELFVDVCRAVQHAHQKGIIHRDLKPSNVMVTLHDDKPVAKVIDFGISKALSQKLTEKTVYTAYGQMVGTPLYMSPEQAATRAASTSTPAATSIRWACCCTSCSPARPPSTRKRCRQSGFDELRRIIREVDPPAAQRPAQHARRPQRCSTVSDNRRIDPRKLSQHLRGELDWIVMKALEKDRNRRYESASAFAADVERYLDDEPLEACPPSVRYRLQKAMKRNKALLATVSVVLATAITGMVVSLSYARKANQAAETAKS